MAFQTNRTDCIETERLILLPLTAEEYRLWLADLPALEAALCCRYDGEDVTFSWTETVNGKTVTERYADVLTAQLAVVEAAPADYLFTSFWWLIRKEDGTVLGSADFKAPPGRDGIVEIGYGLGKAHEHRGYMTEAVFALCRWALARQDVHRVIAATERDNLPSQNVLSRCGFTRYHEDDELWWKIDKK